MNREEAIEQLKLNNPFMCGKDKELFSQAIDKGIEALEDIITISEALIAICEHECCMYGMEEAVKLAEKYTEDIKCTTV